MGTLYIVYAGKDEEGVHWSKVGFFNDGGTIEEKLDWLNKEGEWADKKKGGPFANKTGWRKSFDFRDDEITHELEQDIHIYLETLPEAQPGNVLELYHAEPLTLYSLIRDKFDVISRQVG